MRTYNIKTRRTFTSLRQYAWIFTLLVAFGGLWYPKLGLLVFAVIFSLAITSLFKGRFWCGNFCAHGSLFDQLLLPFSRNGKIPVFLKSRYTQSAVLVWFAYNLGSKFIRVSGLWGSLQFWDRLGFVFVASYLMVTIAGGTLGLLFSPRSWCQFCPMGTMQILMYKLGKLLGWTKKFDQKITVEAIDKCHKCAKCARVCPMQLVPYTDFSEKNQFDDEACIRCLTCVENCPAHILSLSTEAEAYRGSGEKDLRGYDSRQRIRARVASVTEFSKDTREYTFEFIEPSTVSFLPGQFFLVKVEDGPEMFRAYSISGMGASKEVRVTIKLVPDGDGSSYIFEHFTEGTEVVLEGPLGQELLIDPSAEKVLLVGGGIGITPFVPVLQELASAGKEVKLVYGVNTTGEIIFDDIFTALAAESPSVGYYKVVARPAEGYSGRSGFVTDVVKDLDLTGYTVYMCGSKGMVNATREVLRAKGVPSDRIFSESA